MSAGHDLLPRLLQGYCHYWSRTVVVQQARRIHGRHLRKSWAMTPEKKTALTKMVVFCRAENMDPERWLYALFVFNDWRCAPTFDRLRRPEAKEVYADARRMRRFDDWRAATRRDEQMKADKEAYNKERDLNHGVEMLKRSYQLSHDSELCMDMPERTYGYHPGSTWCRQCEVATECLRRYQRSHSFDVLALRRGVAG